MLTVDASSNPYQIWTASLMRWARKAPLPSDEGQAHRLPRSSKKTKYLGCNKDGHILFASVCFSAEARLDEAEIASQWIHHFNVCHFGSFNPHGWTETPMFGRFNPKYGWRVENMSES